MRLTKRQLKQLINEVAMGGVGPGFHGFQANKSVSERVGRGSTSFAAHPRDGLRDGGGGAALARRR